MIAEGEYGPIEGCGSDSVVFGRYRSTGTWSPELVRLLSRMLASGGTLLDVGAHIGLVSIGVARASPARCLAFEPAPDNHRLLQRNVERQGLAQRIEPLALALDSQSGDVELALSEDNSGDHRLLRHPRARSDRRAVVACSTLDAVLAGRELPRPWVMKLDTQGAEARVLAGASATLPRIETLVIEYWPAGLHRMGDSATDLRAVLAEHFAWAAVLSASGALPALQPARAVLDGLRWVAEDGSDPGFFDLVLSRRPL